MVLPLLLIFLIGIVDVGRLMWTVNRAEKATQMGVRFAAVTDVALEGLESYDFYTTGGIARGETIPEDSFTSASCTSAGCACDPSELCTGGISAGFTNTVARMQSFMSEIEPENVQVEYGYSGLGYSGDPYGPDVNPLITVKLVNMRFSPALTSLFGVSITLPSFASTLSMEDGVGTVSN